MKLIPIHRYKKKVQKVSDDKLLKMRATCINLNQRKYAQICTEEMERRGMI